MVGVFVAFIRVVYGRMIYMSLPVPLSSIDTETVAEAVVSRVGIPSEILTDMGTQSTSSVMKEVSRFLSLKQLVTSPYHPICDGLVERFNQTLKKMCAEQPKDWDKYIDPLVFAYREAPQESLGFSPFELLYGWPVRGSMEVLKQLNRIHRGTHYIHICLTVKRKT